MPYLDWNNVIAVHYFIKKLAFLKKSSAFLLHYRLWVQCYIVGYGLDISNCSNWLLKFVLKWEVRNW